MKVDAEKSASGASGAEVSGPIPMWGCSRTRLWSPCRRVQLLEFFVKEVDECPYGRPVPRSSPYAGQRRGLPRRIRPIPIHETGYSSGSGPPLESTGTSRTAAPRLGRGHKVRPAGERWRRFSASSGGRSRRDCHALGSSPTAYQRRTTASARRPVGIGLQFGGRSEPGTVLPAVGVFQFLGARPEAGPLHREALATRISSLIGHSVPLPAGSIPARRNTNIR